MLSDAPNQWIARPYTICWILWIGGAGLLACSVNDVVSPFVGWIGFGVAVVGTAVSYGIQAWYEDRIQKLRSPEHGGDEFTMTGQVDDVQRIRSTVTIKGLNGHLLTVETVGAVRIRSRDFGARTLHVTAGTSFSDGQARAIDDLNSGDRIRVSFIPDSDLATRIESMVGA